MYLRIQIYETTIGDCGWRQAGVLKLKRTCEHDTYLKQNLDKMVREFKPNDLNTQEYQIQMK